MPEIFGLGLPAWAVLIYILLTNKTSTDLFKKILSPLGFSFVKGKKADLETERWMRQRADWSADKAFDILESTIKDYQTTLAKRDQILMDLAVSIQKNTATAAQQTEMIRILAQNAAKTGDELAAVRSHIETVWLRHDEKS